MTKTKNMYRYPACNNMANKRPCPLVWLLSAWERKKYCDGVNRSFMTFSLIHQNLEFILGDW